MDARAGWDAEGYRNIGRWDSGDYRKCRSVAPVTESGKR